MEQRLAKFLSYLLHPLFIPLYYTIFLNWFTGSHFLISLNIRLFSVITVLLFACVFPLAIIVVLKQYPFFKIKTWQMEDREERNVPYTLVAVGFFAAYRGLEALDFPIYQYLKIFLLASTMVIIIAVLVNLKWKISMHMIGMGGLTAAVFALFMFRGDYFEFLLLLFLISGVLATARLLLSSHNLAQLFVGYLLGFSVVGSFYAYWYFN